MSPDEIGHCMYLIFFLFQILRSEYLAMQQRGELPVDASWENATPQQNVSFVYLFVCFIIIRTGNVKETYN